MTIDAKGEGMGDVGAARYEPALQKMSYFQVITTMLTTGTDDTTFWLSPELQLWPGNRTFLEVASIMVTWQIVAFTLSGKLPNCTGLVNITHINIHKDSRN